MPNLGPINPITLAQVISPYYQSANQSGMQASSAIGDFLKLYTKRKMAQEQAAAEQGGLNFMKPLGGAGAGAALGAVLAAPTGGLSMPMGALLGAGAGGGLGSMMM